MTKAKSWTLLAVVAVVVVFAAGWFIALSPQKAKVSNLQSQSSTKLQANQQLTGQISLLKKQESQIPAEQAQIAAIQDRLPATPALAAYIRFVTLAASATHVDLVSVAPAAPVQTKVQQPTATSSAQASASAATAAAPAAASELSAIPITISVNGDYYNVQQFLTKLESAQRATVVSSVSLSPGQPLQPQGSTTASTATLPTWETLQGQITLSIFESSAPSVVAPVAAPAASPAASASPAPSASSPTTKN
jgi:Tfp pilus assembly protein PilO